MRFTQFAILILAMSAGAANGSEPASPVAPLAHVSSDVIFILRTLQK